MPLTYSTKVDRGSNTCLHCGESLKHPKRFCNDQEKIQWLEQHHPWHPDWRGAVELEKERRRNAITWESLEWKRKLSLSRPF